MRNLIVEWLLGTVCLFIGSVYLLNVNPAVLGATDYSVGATLGISFLLYLVTGYLWIGLVPETLSRLNTNLNTNFDFSWSNKNKEEIPSVKGEETPTESGTDNQAVNGEIAHCGTPDGC